MKWCMLFISFGVIELTSVGQNPNPSAAIDAFIANEMEVEQIPGMATVIVKDGEIVWLKGYGLADIGNNISVTDSTVFLLASVSKLFTGTALMRLVQEGWVQLDEDINHSLTTDIDVPGFESDSITYRHLLTHTSSIEDNDMVMDTYYSNGDPTVPLSEVILNYFNVVGSNYSPDANFHDSAPGTIYDYSNMGTALAGYMVEAIVDEDFNDYCEANIFQPLCMDHTSWYLSGYDTSQVARPYQWTGTGFEAFPHYGFADYPNGQLRSTIVDLANFMLAYLQDGTFSSYQLLEPVTVSQMLSPQITALDPTQGLSWYLEDIYLNSGGTVQLWGHNGGEDGVSTDLYLDTDSNIGIAVLSNGEGENLYVVDELYNYALGLNASGVGNPPCLASGISQHAESSPLKVYPNPAKDLLQVEIHGAEHLRIVDHTGRLVHFDPQPDQHVTTINLGALSPGLYQLMVVADGKVFSKPVLMTN